MKRIFTLFVFCSLFSIFAACSDSDSNALTCGTEAEIIADQPFGQITTANYTITSVALNEDCLDISISSSGCDGSHWETDLFSNQQRQLKLELTNPELCLAIVSKTISYDVRPLRVDGQNQVTLTIEGWAQPVVYNY